MERCLEIDLSEPVEVREERISPEASRQAMIDGMLMRFDVARPSVEFLVDRAMPLTPYRDAQGLVSLELKLIEPDTE